MAVGSPVLMSALATVRPPQASNWWGGEWRLRRWLGLLGAGILALVAGCSGTPTASQKCHWPPVLGTPSMPTPERLTAAIVLNLNGFQFTPAPRRLNPKISALQAWHAVSTTFDKANGLQIGPRYRLALAEWNGPTVDGMSGSGAEVRPVWVVLGDHVAVHPFGGRRTSCVSESAAWPVDATIGLNYGELT